MRARLLARLQFEDLTATDFERVMQVNFHGTVNCVRAAAPGMRMRAQAGVGARPHIGLVGSMAGHAGLYGYTAYSASKFALRGFAEALRMEMQVDGVRVSLALPPDTDTPQLAAERATMPAVTRSMSGAGGEFSAERVAADILKVRCAPLSRVRAGTHSRARTRTHTCAL